MRHPDQPVFPAARYLKERQDREVPGDDFHRRVLEGVARRGVNLLIHRVAISPEYGGMGPTHIRREWAFSDFIDALIMLDALDEIRQRERENAERDARLARGGLHG